MIYKCPILLCSRTFSLRSAYSQHVQVCIRKAELESNPDSDNNSENNENEVVIDYIDSNYQFLMNLLFRWNMKVKYKTCHLVVLEVRKVIYYPKFQ